MHVYEALTVLYDPRLLIEIRADLTRDCGTDEREPSMSAIKIRSVSINRPVIQVQWPRSNERLSKYLNSEKISQLQLSLMQSTRFSKLRIISQLPRT